MKKPMRTPVTEKSWRCQIVFWTILLLSVVGPASGGDGDTPRRLSERFGLVHGDPEFLVELGSAWNRHDFTWAGIERERGVFDFGEYPARVAESLRRGVHILPILDYEPAWKPGVSPADDETRDLWARYVERTVAEFKGKLRHWQVWNEPNISFWKPEPNPRDYAELLRRSYLAAKKVDPDVKILGLNCSNIDLEFTEEVFRYGGLNYCDVLAYQPYRIAPEVGHFEEVAALRELVARFGEQRPIWFTEMGWGSEHFPFADAADLLAENPSRRQAAFLVRYMTIIQAVGIEKVFWFAQSAGSAGLEDRKADKKRLSFHAYRHLIATLDDYTDVRELIPYGSGGLYAYLFTCPDKAVVVAWSVNGPREIAFPDLGRVREARDMLGEPFELPNRKHLALGGEPIYLLFEEVLDQLEQVASLRVRPTRIWLEPGERESVNLLWKPKDGTASGARGVDIQPPLGARVKPTRLSLAPGEEASFTVAVGSDAKPSRRRIRLRSGEADWDVEVNIVPRTLWEYHGEGKGYLTPTLLRDADGSVSVLVAAYNTPYLICLSPEGKRFWRYTAGAPINCSVVVANINDDARPEIVAAMPRLQTIIALSADGVLLWRAKLPGEPPPDHPQCRWTRPEAADLDGDGANEIVYADSQGTVTVLSGQGETVWTKQVSEHRCDRPILIDDILGDKHAEILVGDEAGTLFCLSHAGQVIWKADAGADVSAAPVAGALKPSGPASILVGTRGERLLRISPDGETLWSTELGGTMDLGSGIVLVDLDGDAANEIVASTRNHEVIALDEGGHILWRVETGAQIRSVPAVGDVDGDGEDEILVGSADWLMYCIDRRGQVEWTVKVGNRVDASPLLADLNGDGVDDIVMPVRGGTIFAFSATPRGR